MLLWLGIALVVLLADTGPRDRRSAPLAAGALQAPDSSVASRRCSARGAHAHRAGARAAEQHDETRVLHGAACGRRNECATTAAGASLARTHDGTASRERRAVMPRALWALYHRLSAVTSVWTLLCAVITVAATAVGGIDSTIRSPNHSSGTSKN